MTFDTFPFTIVFILAGIVCFSIFFSALKVYLNRRIVCPKCKQKGHSEETGEENMGTNFASGSKEKYRTFYTCKNCNHKWADISEMDDRN
jgi:DNA-directed RNA polymerase subunit RPC12/RpoP